MESLTEPAAVVFLARHAAQVPAHQAIVELGVHQGGSLIPIAHAAAHGNRARVYGIDAWGLSNAYDGRPHMRDRYPADNQQVTQFGLDNAGVHAFLYRDLTVYAAETWDGPPVGLLFIDAEHTYDAVRADFHAWRPHLAAGALVAFDDYDASKAKFAGVIRAVDELVDEFLHDFEVVGSRLAVART